MMRRGGLANELTLNGELMTICGFQWNNQLFLYYECLNQVIEPEAILPELAPFLEEWPGEAVPRTWIPLIDVFHFNAPASPEHWLRKGSVERRVGRIAHLKPEMAASYVYYHYQLQEEWAFHGPKYEIIGLHENLLFGYQEFPAVVEQPVLPKKLQTAGTPNNWGDARMDLHFQPWPDGHLYFKPIETIFTYYSGDART
jgi:hypothetical protein